MTVERDWFWFWFYYALWLASVFTLVLVLRQSSENRSMWVVQWYYIFEGLVEMCEVVGVGLYWKLIGKIMGVVREVVAGFLHGVVFI